MNKIPTAEEIILKQGLTKSPVSGLETYLKSNAKNAMIEFAKLHVEAALKEASEQANLKSKNDFGVDITSLFTSTERGGHGLPDLYSEVSVNKDSILNAYPLENIK